MTRPGVLRVAVNGYVRDGVGIVQLPAPNRTCGAASAMLPRPWQVERGFGYTSRRGVIKRDCQDVVTPR